MAGYKQRTETLKFEDLADDCWVEIRNPKMLTRDDLPDLTEDATLAEQEAAGMAATAALVVRWNVWAINDESDNPAVLPLPKDDPSVLRRVPIEIIAAIGAKVAEANPQTPSTPTSDSTS